jgi:hypothetical protein
MAVEVEIDVQVLKSEIKKTYASVSQEPEKDYIFPTGRPWARSPGSRIRGSWAGSRPASAFLTSAPAPAPTRSLPRRWSASAARSPGSI